MPAALQSVLNQRRIKMSKETFLCKTYTRDTFVEASHDRNCMRDGGHMVTAVKQVEDKWSYQVLYRNTLADGRPTFSYGKRLPEASA